MWRVILLVVYCLFILLASLAGGWIPLAIRLTHRRMECAVSLVAGVMLGVGLLHMLPHALAEAPNRMESIFGWVLVGFLAMFLIERFFYFHRHEVPSHEDHGAYEKAEEPSEQHAEHWAAEAHRLTWGGAAMGLTLHAVIAGVALAASVQADVHSSSPAPLAGLGTFLAIFLHKPFDAMTISTLMTVGGWSMAARHLVNAMFALTIPVGVILFHAGLGYWSHDTPLVAYALAFSAGTFLCIAMSDLLPELHFHRHDRVILSISLFLGLSMAWGVAMLEDLGAGEHMHPAPAERRDHPEHSRHDATSHYGAPPAERGADGGHPH